MRLGDLRMKGPEANWVKAAEAYLVGCDAGDGTSCRKLGDLHAHGRGVPRSEEEAAKRWRQACEAKEQRACVQLAGAMSEDEGQGREALRLASEACTEGIASGCFDAARLGEKGGGSAAVDTETLRARAVDLWTKACASGDHDACLELGSTAVDNKLGQIPLVESACKADHGPSCDFLGLIMARQPEDARRYYRRACQTGFLDACGEMVRLDLVLAHKDISQSKLPSIIEQSMEILEQACERGGWKSCVTLGDILALSGTPLDDYHARAWYERACIMGAPPGCPRLGYMYRKKRGLDVVVPWESGSAMIARKDKFGPRHPQAAVAMADACKESWSDFGDGCAGLGALHEAGLGVERSEKEAAKHYRTACEKGSPPGCAELARLYRKGIGVEKNVTEARQWTREERRRRAQRRRMKIPEDTGAPR